MTHAVRELARASVARLDLGTHQGAHPRQGVLDVVPFIPYTPGRLPSHGSRASAGATRISPTVPARRPRSASFTAFRP